VVKYDTKYGSGLIHQCVSLQQRFYTFKRNVGLVIETSMYHCIVELVVMLLVFLRDGSVMAEKIALCLWCHLLQFEF
jgi:hypothetical protein